MPQLHTRASKACSACRIRKIRCNVTTNGVPCASCSSAGIKCSTDPAKRAIRRFTAKEHQSVPTGLHIFDMHTIAPAHENASEADNVLEDQPPQDVSFRIENFLANAPQALDFNLDQALSAATYGHSTSSTSSVYHDSANYRVPGEDVPMNSLEFSQEYPTVDGWTSATQTVGGNLQTGFSPPQQQPFRRTRLPEYIQPLRGQLAPDDLMFLEQKRALSVPEGPLQDELLQSYLLYVHPFLPLLDLETFLQALNNDGHMQKIPLILFQAVMFCGVPFVDMRYLHNEGLKSREQARCRFFEKVRLLFDFNVELDPMTLIRATLLMTYWYDMPEDTKGRWYWLRIGLSYAYEIGLNRRAQPYDLSLAQQQSRRRLWWCCYTRERLTCLTERRQSTIHEGDADLDIPTLDDFQTQLFINVLRRYDISVTERQANILNQLCIEKIKLCVIFGRVLDTLYVPRGHRRFSNSEIKVVLVPRESDLSVRDVVGLDQELSQWSTQYRSNLKDLHDPNTSSQDCDIVRLHQGLLNLVYHSVCSMVHLPQCRQDLPLGSAAHALQVIAGQKLSETAQESTGVAKRLMNEGLIERLAPIAIVALLFAGMQHINDMCSVNVSARVAAALFLEQTLQCLGRLREVYGSARHAIGLLKIVHQAKDIGPFPGEQHNSTSSPGNRSGVVEAPPQPASGALHEQSRGADGQKTKYLALVASPSSSSFAANSGRDHDVPFEIDFDLESIINMYSP